MSTKEKVCWFCGKETMVPVDTFYQCKTCLATYNDTIKDNPPLLENGGRVVKDQHGNRLLKANQLTLAGSRRNKLQGKKGK